MKPQRPAKPIEAPFFTPHGLSTEHRFDVAPGIHAVGTPQANGFHLSDERLAEMPESFRAFGPWFMKDDTDAMVLIAFESHFVTEATERGDYDVEPRVADAMQRVVDRYPDEASAAGIEFDPADSKMLRMRAFYNAHQGDYIKIHHAIASRKHEDVVPPGYVGIVARVGGIGGPGPEASFLIPADEHRDADKEFGFVVDPARHKMLDGNPLAALVERYQVVEPLFKTMRRLDL